MPFTTHEDRIQMDAYCQGTKLSDWEPAVGDWCYIYYKKMVEQWKANPRWTTAHLIYQAVLLNDEPNHTFWTAQSLAWQVFFQLHVMPYELEKRRLNGDVG
jgi:hypothetical protein